MATCDACRAGVGAADRFCRQCGEAVDRGPDATSPDAAAGDLSRDATARDAAPAPTAPVQDDAAVAPGHRVPPGAGGGGFTNPQVPALFRQGPAPGSHPETIRVELDDEPTSTGGRAPTEVLAVTGGVDLANCPGCGSVNAIQRQRCARCGTLLQDDVDEADDQWGLRELPSVSDVTEVTPAPSAREAGSSRRIGISVVVVGAILGALLAGWMFGLGFFARSEGPGVTFDGNAYPGQAEPVRPDRALTTPTREPEGDRRFGVRHAVDGDLTTAWVAVDGDDARLQFTFDRPVWVTSIELANGDQHDEETFAQTARIRTMDVDFGFGSTLRATLLSGTGHQAFRPPAPVLTDHVALEVVDTTEGVDVGLSEITFVGFAADQGDARAFAEAS